MYRLQFEKLNQNNNRKLKLRQLFKIQEKSKFKNG
jgi:hypothetical protein